MLSSLEFIGEQLIFFPLQKLNVCSGKSRNFHIIGWQPPSPSRVGSPSGKSWIRTDLWPLERPLSINSQGPIHTVRKRKRMWKRTFSLMFEIFSLISSDWSLIFFRFHSMWLGLKIVHCATNGRKANAKATRFLRESNAAIRPCLHTMFLDCFFQWHLWFFGRIFMSCVNSTKGIDSTHYKTVRKPVQKTLRVNQALHWLKTNIKGNVHTRLRHRSM